MSINCAGTRIEKIVYNNYNNSAYKTASCTTLFSKKTSVMIMLRFHPLFDCFCVICNQFENISHNDFVIDDAACIGIETSIFDCKHAGERVDNCNYKEWAGVKCKLNGGSSQEVISGSCANVICQNAHHT